MTAGEFSWQDPCAATVGLVAAWGSGIGSFLDESTTGFAEISPIVATTAHDQNLHPIHLTGIVSPTDVLVGGFPADDFFAPHRAPVSPGGGPFPGLVDPPPPRTSSQRLLLRSARAPKNVFLAPVGPAQALILTCLARQVRDRLRGPFIK